MKAELRHPTLILLAGIPSSGKTTLGKALARSITDSLLIDKDTINDAFLRQRDPADKGTIADYRVNGHRYEIFDDFYHDHVRFQTYDAMIKIAKDNVELGKHPIHHAVFPKEMANGYIREIVLPQFERVKLLLCYADEATIRRRIMERASPRDADKFSDWQRWLRDNPIIPPQVEEYDHLKINTEEDLGVCVEKAITYLQ